MYSLEGILNPHKALDQPAGIKSLISNRTSGFHTSETGNYVKAVASRAGAEWAAGLPHKHPSLTLPGVCGVRPLA